MSVDDFTTVTNASAEEEQHLSDIMERLSDSAADPLRRDSSKDNSRASMSDVRPTALRSDNQSASTARDVAAGVAVADLRDLGLLAQLSCPHCSNKSVRLDSSSTAKVVKWKGSQTTTHGTRTTRSGSTVYIRRHSDMREMKEMMQQLLAAHATTQVEIARLRAENVALREELALLRTSPVA
ncbi:hypothetical protein RI367_003851 [Sorochytrium milnesiophthora]